MRIARTSPGRIGEPLSINAWRRAGTDRLPAWINCLFADGSPPLSRSTRSCGVWGRRCLRVDEVVFCFSRLGVSSVMKTKTATPTSPSAKRAGSTFRRSRFLDAGSSRGGGAFSGSFFWLFGFVPGLWAELLDIAETRPSTQLFTPDERAAVDILARQEKSNVVRRHGALAFLPDHDEPLVVSHIKPAMNDLQMVLLQEVMNLQNYKIGGR